MRVRASTASILRRPLLHSEQEPCIIFVRIIANCAVDSFTLECRARSRCCVLLVAWQRGFKEEERNVYGSEENGGGCGEYRTRANGCIIIYCSHETQAFFLSSSFSHLRNILQCTADVFDEIRAIVMVFFFISNFPVAQREKFLTVYLRAFSR